MSDQKQKDLFIQSKKLVGYGVNTPMYDSFKEDPGIMFVKYASGSKITDLNSKQLIDFVCGYGALILGHGSQPIRTAISEQLLKGHLYGLPTEEEIQLCQMIVASSPCIQQVRFFSSGTEAVMSAVRQAKFFTGRELLLKFNGSYHGHADTVLGRYRPNIQRGDCGVNVGIYDHTIIAKYGDLDDLHSAFNQYPHQIAAVIIEPLACNAGLAKPSLEFLSTLRRYCNEHGTVLIFDEVITGFRANYGSISNEWKIYPDLLTFGKIVGGGTPIGIYAGRTDIMSYKKNGLIGFPFAGTFSANPLAVAAGLATLKILATGHVYSRLDQLGFFLESSMNESLKAFRDYYHLERFKSIFSFKLQKDGADYAENYADYSRLHTLMMKRGFLMTPSPDETMYISNAHSQEDIASFIMHLTEVLKGQFFCKR